MACEVDFNRLRSLAIELQRRVNTLFTAIHAIHQITSTWTVDRENIYLPSATAVKVQLAAYKLLSIPQISLADTIREIEQCDELIPAGVVIPETGIIFPSTNPISF